MVLEHLGSRAYVCVCVWNRQCGFSNLWCPLLLTSDKGRLDDISIFLVPSRGNTVWGCQNSGGMEDLDAGDDFNALIDEDNDIDAGCSAEISGLQSPRFSVHHFRCPFCTESASAAREGRRFFLKLSTSTA